MGIYGIGLEVFRIVMNSLCGFGIHVGTVGNCWDMLGMVGYRWDLWSIE